MKKISSPCRNLPSTFRHTVGSLFASLALLTFGFGCEANSNEKPSQTTDDGTEESACSQAWQTKQPGTPSLMDAWGSTCVSDADCIAKLGFANSICVHDVLGVYTLPEGYCTRPCRLPSKDVSVVPNDPNCHPNDGIDCIGALDQFEACAPPCIDASQCGRIAYGCITMPDIGSEADPRYCLMNPNACLIPPSF